MTGWQTGSSNDKDFDWFEWLPWQVQNVKSKLYVGIADKSHLEIRLTGQNTEGLYPSNLRMVILTIAANRNLF